MPIWSPDGRWIAFVRAPREANGNVWLYAVSVDGRIVRRLARVAVAGWGFHPPVWSPDSRRIAFTRTVTDPLGTPRARTYVINADGGDQRLLVSSTSVGDVHGPTWSPDGSRIAYAASDGSFGSNRIYAIDVKRDRQRLLASDRNGIDSPAWSPAGTRSPTNADPRD